MSPFSALKNYFESAKLELEKVAWPSKEQTTRYSLAIIGASVAAALFFTALDSGLHAGVAKLISLRGAARATVNADQAQTVIPEASLSTSTTPSTAGNAQVQLTPTVEGNGTVKVTPEAPIIPTAPSPTPTKK
jgi:preprotein translocase SecE subunit